jgi:fibronectin-binding autotransporter adhesin
VAGAVGGSNITVNKNGTLAETVSNGLTGAQTLTVTGGAAILSQDNNYTGLTTLNSGTLTLSNSLAMQNSTLGGAGTGLVFDSSVASHAFTVAGLGGSGNIVLADNAATPNAVALTVGNNNVSSTYAGILSGGGSLTKIGTGTFITNNAASQTFSGGLIVQNGVFYAEAGGAGAASFGAGSVSLGTAGAANTTGIAFSNTGRTFANAFTTLGTGGTNTIQVQGGGQNFVFTGGFTLNNNLTLSTIAGNDSITVSTGGIAGTGNLVTSVSTGTSLSGLTGQLTGGAITISSGVNNTGTVTNNGAGSALVTINGVIGTNVTGVTQNSTTSGLTLGGANTYTGPTTVTAGLLTLASAGSINGSTSVSVANTGALTLTNAASLADTGTLSLVSNSTLTLGAANGTSETIGSLILNGNVEPAGTYNATSLAALTGAGGITFTSSFGETLTVTAVPEPSTWISGLVGLGVLGFRVRRRVAGLFNRQSVA